ncbi:mitochondrial phosphate carrier protein 3, mitochondrial [Ricinus communis]|uniref:mitochondrial phosphate carrier protein 3, mitochondrial n=1 Tax=Ricinus communis TaxID=3988 RepID=UPI000772D045|nr:mitochondrial phosphate carrier protein 3, mitochondrial [Ricinus communis]XP_048233966.1 mitochondrial phosphate carrier protein 3, mitochondrial [Ricinus communis]|eukprot:XP_015570933.1 mitochondrial phosphate carrier protein 3, mitochondrial [Ricinus communis]
MQNAVKKIGLRGQFRVVMIGTLTGAQWGIYDAFKASVGLNFFLPKVQYYGKGAPGTTRTDISFSIAYQLNMVDA